MSSKHFMCVIRALVNMYIFIYIFYALLSHITHFFCSLILLKIKIIILYKSKFSDYQTRMTIFIIIYSIKNMTLNNWTKENIYKQFSARTVFYDFNNFFLWSMITHFFFSCFVVERIVYHLFVISCNHHRRNIFLTTGLFLYLEFLFFNINALWILKVCVVISFTTYNYENM